MGENWKEVTAEWQGEMQFHGKNQTGGTVSMGGGDSSGVSPMELLLMGVAGCTGIDVVHILGKMKKEIESFEVIVRGKRADEYPMVYTEVEIEYLIWADGLEAKSVEHAIELSENKYCSASAMMSKTAQIRSSYKILSPESETN